MTRYALLGAAGFIAPRHLRAMRETGGELVAACDPHDSVGVLDSYFPTAEFFTDPFKFSRYIEGNRVHYVVVATPNDRHFDGIRDGLDAGANVICEKPLVLYPWELDDLREDEARSGCRVHPILQLRYHPAIAGIRARVGDGRRHTVSVRYVTPRGPWYQKSWKGDRLRSGGILVNIGIHIFDALIHLFGPAEQLGDMSESTDHAFGEFATETADVVWFLSINRNESPVPRRVIEVDGEAVDFSGGFDDLHTVCYREILAGRGFGLDDAAPAIELIERMRGE